MSLLTIRELTVQYGTKKILDGVGLTLEQGRWLMLVGPNGAGKSTVVNAVTQGVPYAGRIELLGRDVRRYKPRALAQRVGVLAQSHAVSYSFTVEEVVRLGRYAHAAGVFSARGAQDDHKVEQALALTGLLPLAGQSVLTLSGGELQRTFLAQLLAQDPQLLILDEPTNHLDLVYQNQVFTLLTDWLRADQGRAILSVVHDLSLARAYGTDALLLDAGRVRAAGRVDEVFAAAHLDAAYRMDVSAWMRRMLGQWAGPSGERN